MKFRIEPALGRRIATLSLPVVAAMLSQTAINLVDHVLVGRLPREQSTPGQAALGISLVLLWMIGGFLSALAVGTQAMTARRIGAGRPEDAGAVLSNSLAVAAVGSVVASVAAWVFVPAIFPFLHRDPAVLQLGVPYLRWRFVGVVSMVLTTSYKAFFDGVGRTRVHMYAAIVMNVVNFFLALGLIFGHFGLPCLG